MELFGAGRKKVGTALATASVPLLLELSLLTECRFWMVRAIAEHGDLGDRREMELKEALAVSLMFVGGNSEEVHAALTTALALAQALELPCHQMRLPAEVCESMRRRWRKADPRSHHLKSGADLEEGQKLCVHTVVSSSLAMFSKP